MTSESRQDDIQEIVGLSPDEYLSTLEAARRIGVTRQRMHQLGVEGVGPPRFRVGKWWYYPVDTFETWMAARKRGDIHPAATVRAGVAALAAEWGLLDKAA